LLKLKKNLSRRDKKTGSDFYRYDITIPTSAIKDLGWKNVKNLKYEVKGKKLVIEKE